MRRVVQAMLVVILAWTLIYTFLFIFLCTPIDQQWSLETRGTCLDQMAVLKSLILTNIATDMVIIGLPLQAVWRLNMRSAEKLAMTLCFGLGFASVFLTPILCCHPPFGPLSALQSTVQRLLTSHSTRQMHHSRHREDCHYFPNRPDSEPHGNFIEHVHALQP